MGSAVLLTTPCISVTTAATTTTSEASCCVNESSSSSSSSSSSPSPLSSSSGTLMSPFALLEKKMPCSCSSSSSCSHHHHDDNALQQQEQQLQQPDPAYQEKGCFVHCNDYKNMSVSPSPSSAHALSSSNSSSRISFASQSILQALSVAFDYVFVVDCCSSIKNRFLYRNQRLLQRGSSKISNSRNHLQQEASHEHGCFEGILDMESANRVHDLILQRCEIQTVVATGRRLQHQQQHDDLGVTFIQGEGNINEAEQWELTLFPILDDKTNDDKATTTVVAMGGLVRVRRVVDEKEQEKEENDYDHHDEEQKEGATTANTQIKECDSDRTLGTDSTSSGTFDDKNMGCCCYRSKMQHEEEEEKDDDDNKGETTRTPPPTSTTSAAADAAAANATSATTCQYRMQEAVRESEERHRTLFENMKQGVVYHAADGRTTDANESALRILGLTMDQMLGKTPMDPQWRFINPDGSTIPVEEYPAVVALSGQPVSNKVMGVYYNQNDVHWIVLDAMPRYRPDDDDRDQQQPYEAYTIFSDMTKTKEEELNLLRAKQKAEEADQLKSAFLATMSHEIRTPLNGIMGHLDLILSNGLEEDYKRENLEGLQVAMDSGKLLLSIIQDILDLSKIEAGLLDIDTKSSLDLRSVISNTMKLAHAYQIQCKKDQFAAGRIQLQLETVDARIAKRIHGDEFRLQQVLNNLLSNAIKFTNQGFVSLSIRHYCPNDDHNCHGDCNDGYIEFCVHDTGKGIPEDRLEIIFEPFRQVEFGDTREHGGTGLGLTICKKLIEIMGGTLRVKSSMDSGNTGSWFYFTLPYKPVPLTDNAVSAKDPEKPMIKIRRRRTLVSPSTTASTNTTNTDQPPPTTTILLAEDDFVSRQIATRMLEKAGCTVLKAHDGAQAVSLFEQFRDTIDLILMDVMMPNMDGLEATEKIRNIELTSSKSLESVPIVALSAGAMKGDRERGLQVGMDEYLYKPVTNAALGTMLERYVGRYENGCHDQ